MSSADAFEISDLIRHERGLAELAAVGAEVATERAEVAERQLAESRRAYDRRVLEADEAAAAAEDAAVEAMTRAEGEVRLREEMAAASPASRTRRS